MKELKGYQRGAIDDIRELFDIYINKENKNIILKAPTGSGKTFIVTKLLEEICLDPKYRDQKIAFIWASIGKGDLHKQSYKSVKSELEGNPDCQLLDLPFVQSHKYIEDKQIIFVNWESLVNVRSKGGSWLNILTKEQEGRNFIDLINNTKNNGTKLCLIADESHIGEGEDNNSGYSSRIREFRERIIKPNVTIEMSATPKGTPDVDIDIDEVCDEGMIKENLKTNLGIGKDIESENDKDSIQLVLEKAEEQRKLIIKNYEEVGADINPLVLVQIPNTEMGEATMRVVEDFLSKHEITYENGKLVRWLTGDKEKRNFDPEKMKENNNDISYLIFKTVVDVGWDCPRAHILVALRDVHSTTAKIQTVGRILRTPEAKKYNNEILDNAYIYTNMDSIKLEEDKYLENRIKDVSVKPKVGLDKSLPNLESFYKSRVKSYNAADSRIYRIIEEEFCKYYDIGENDIFSDDKLRSKGLIIDGIDKTSIATETGNTAREVYGGVPIGQGGPLFTANVRSSEIEVESKVDEIISQNLNGLAHVRSEGPILSGMRMAVQTHISGIEPKNSYVFTLKLISANEEQLGRVISNSTKRYKELYPDANMNGEYSPYEIPEEMRYSSSTYEVIESALSLYDHMYVIKQGTSQLERDFIGELDRKYSEVINWVWHNGSEPNIVNFGVEIEPDVPAFRPDYLVKFKDGRLGIFDTKSSGDYQIADTTKKAEALYKYIEENKKAGKNIFGGIIVEHNGNFFLNQNEKYASYDEDPDSYTNIAFIF